MPDFSRFVLAFSTVGLWSSLAGTRFSVVHTLFGRGRGGARLSLMHVYSLRQLHSSSLFCRHLPSIPHQDGGALKALSMISWRDPSPAGEHCIAARINEAAATTFGFRSSGSAYFSLPLKGLELYMSYQMSQSRAFVEHLDVSSRRAPSASRKAYPLPPQR